MGGSNEATNRAEPHGLKVSGKLPISATSSHSWLVGWRAFALSASSASSGFRWRRCSWCHRHASCNLRRESLSESFVAVLPFLRTPKGGGFLGGFL